MIRVGIAAILFVLLFFSSHLPAQAEGPGSLVSTAPILFLTGRPGDSNLRQQLDRLVDAMNKRDIAAIRSQISASRLYVEIENKPGAFLSNSQTIVVLESFFRSQTSIHSAFDFVSDDGVTGSASGTLATRKDGHALNYKLSCGFTKTGKTQWMLTRISIR